MIDKEAAFCNLMEKMDENKCPICAMVKFRMNEMMERFFYENVNSPHLRYKIEKANGFCSRHAHKLLKQENPLSHAILYHDFMYNVIHNVADKKNKVAYDEHKGCFFCEGLNMNEEDYTKAFLEFFDNKDFKEKYISSSIICVPHLVAIRKLKFTNKKTVTSLTEETLKKYEVLNGHLSEVKRKSDYRYTNEEWTDEEKKSWKEAVDIFNGMEY